MSISSAGPSCGAAVMTVSTDDEIRTLEGEVTSLRNELASKDRQIEGLRFNYQAYIDLNEEVNKVQAFIYANFSEEIAQGYIPNLAFGSRVIAVMLRLMKKAERKSLWRRIFAK